MPSHGVLRATTGQVHKGVYLGRGLDCVGSLVLAFAHGVWNLGAWRGRVGSVLVRSAQGRLWAGAALGSVGSGVATEAQGG